MPAELKKNLEKSIIITFLAIVSSKVSIFGKGCGNGNGNDKSNIISGSVKKLMRAVHFIKKNIFKSVKKMKVEWILP